MKSGHRCAAIRCEHIIPPEMLMCYAHWKKVPKPIQNEVWRTYRKGQENDLSLIGPGYREAVRAAVEAVAAKEGL